MRIFKKWLNSRVLVKERVSGYRRRGRRRYPPPAAADNI
jgi:hypothetical protein